MVTRFDQTTDEELLDQLLTARRGTAFWHRKVEELSDEALDGPTLLPGWTRRHLIAHVGYNARALTRLVQWANTGIETPMYESTEQRSLEIELGATMPARALRHLNHHAAVSLNVEWRDTPEDKWDAQVVTAQGRNVPLTETVWMRTREVWLHAVDLDNGAQFSDIPQEVLIRLLGDITGAWRSRGTDPGYSIKIEDHEALGFFGEGYDAVSSFKVQGRLPDVVAWAAGRGGNNLTMGGELSPPRWI